MSSPDIILQTALIMTGPQQVGETHTQYTQRVTRNIGPAHDLHTNTRTGPAALAHILPNCALFTGTIRAVKKEPTSTRAIVHIETTPTAHYPGGEEALRTPRTENNPHTYGWQLAETLKNLIGHKVLIWKEIQKTKDGHDVRIIQHVRDLGKPKETP